MSINIGTLDIAVAFAGDTAGLQKATTEAQQGIDRFGATTSKAMRQVREDTQGVEAALGRLSQGFKGAVIGSSVVVGLITLKNTAMEAAGALIQAQVQLDKLNNGFKFGAGGSAGGARELAFVREEANRLGLELGGAATQYMKMVAAARGTNMEGAKTRELFTSIAEASTVMGMSGEQSERAMQAVVQMMSKGKVQAEELRGQLGEHLPGAFAIAARAMGVTEVELNKLMETGQVMSADFLPKFAAQLRNELGGSVDDATKSMQASLNRYETAWLTFKQNVAESGVSDAIGGQINILSDAFNGISERMEAARKAGGGFWSQAAAGAGGVAQFLNPINALSYSAISLQGQLEQAETKLNELEKERPYSGNIFLGPAIEETKLLIAELERAKAARDQLSRQPGTGASESRYSAMADAEAVKAQQAKGQAYAKLMGDLATPQEKLTEAIFKSKKELGELYSPEIEARLRSHFIKPTHEAKEKIDELTKSAMRGLELYSDLTATEGGLGKDFSEKWVQLSDARAKDYISAEQLLAAQSALLKLQPFAVKGLQDEAKAMEQASKAAAAYASDLDRLAIADADVIEMANQYTDSVDDRIRATTFEAGLIGKSNVERSIALKQYQIEIELQKQILDIKKKLASQQEQDDAIAAVTRAADRAKANAAAEVVNEEFQRVSQQIEQSLTDALMRGFENGKGFAEVLRDTVVNMFKTLVLRPVIQGIVQTGMGYVGFGPGGTAGGAGGNGMSFASGAGMYNQFATSSAGQYVGLSTPGTVDAMGDGVWGSSPQLTTFGQNAGQYIQSAGQVLGYATALNTAFSRNAQGGKDYGKAAGQALGTYFGGPIGSMIGGEIGAALGLVDYGGTYHTGGLASYSLAGGAQVGDAAKAAGLNFGLDSKDYNTDAEKAALIIAQGVGSMLDSTAESFGGKAGYSVATAFARDISPSGEWGALTIKDQAGKSVVDWKDGQDKWPGREFADGEAGAKEYAAAVAKDVRDYLITQTPDWADTMLTALGDAPTLEQLGATVAEINKTQAALTSMGAAMPQIATLSESSTAALLTAAGGIDSLASAATAYYDGFHSESEKTALNLQSLQEAFADQNLALPDTIQSYRALVEAQDLNTEAGRANYLMLMDMAPAYRRMADEGARYMSVLDGAAKKYLNPDQYQAYTYERASTQLKGLGFDFSAEILQATDTSSIKAWIVELARTGAVSSDTLASLIALADGLIDVKGSSDVATDALANVTNLTRANANSANGGGFSLNSGGYGGLVENPEVVRLQSLMNALVAETKTALEEIAKGVVSASKNVYDELEQQALLKAEEMGLNSRKSRLPGLDEAISADSARAKAAGDALASGDVNTMSAYLESIGFVLDGNQTVDEMGSLIQTIFYNIASGVGYLRQIKDRIGTEAEAMEAEINKWLLTQKRLASVKEQASLKAEIESAYDQIASMGTGGDPYKDLAVKLAKKYADYEANFGADLEKEVLRLQTEANPYAAALEDGTISAEEAAALGFSNASSSGGSGLGSVTEQWTKMAMEALAMLNGEIGTLTGESEDMLKMIEDWGKAQEALLNARRRKEIQDMLDGDIKSLYGSVDSTSGMQARAAQQYIDSTIASLRAGGELPDPAKLREAVDALKTGLGQTIYLNKFEEDRAKLVLAGQLGQIKQLTIEEEALDIAHQQLSTLVSINDGIEALVEATNNASSSSAAAASAPSASMSFAPVQSLMADNQRRDETLVAEIRALREENRSQAESLAALNLRLVKLHERWDGNGIPETRNVA